MESLKRKNTKVLRLEMLTGALKESVLELKIRVSVDHAGHSQQLELWNHGHYSKVNQLIFHNSSLLTVADPKETKDAMEDGLTMP